MTASIKPFKLYVFPHGPNPKKVAILLEELGLPYESILIENPKEESYLKINPNGLLPTLVDPNVEDFTIWESGAIAEYLVSTYDQEGKLDGRTKAEKWHAKQYLHFQMSGQGPYFFEAAWFYYYAPEDVPFAKARYVEQTVRIFEVLNKILEGKKWLVGEKLTYADLGFVPWNKVLVDLPLGEKTLSQEYDLKNKYPNVYNWIERLNELESVKKVYSQ
ncbi:glutathione S-transferase [Emericellopsis atlantica]|uniref:Glutathione S-transferase n=1 Tax=Emericellopsis atlantica TaxID=2614577 RepID=A0A9P8CTX7_9HYPO|nr:glutathione S-transferase [Emericellopsis atlantica]KAG9259228.1 glutathione S-transferase [Emericellopsis atlantica]